MLHLCLILLAQNIQAGPVSIRYDHQTLSVFNSAIGKTQSKLGLYSATVCNVTENTVKFDEGQVVVHSPVKAVHPSLNLSVISSAQRASRKNRIFRGLEWAAEGVAVLPGPSKGPRFRFYVTAGAGLFRRFADSTAPSSTPPEVIQALAVTGRTVTLDRGACMSRLFFARYESSPTP